MKRTLIIVSLALILMAGIFTYTQEGNPPILVDIPAVVQPTQAELSHVQFDYGKDHLLSSEVGGETVAWAREPNIIAVFKGISGPLEDSEGTQLTNAWGDLAYGSTTLECRIVITGDAAKNAMVNRLPGNIRAMAINYFEAHPELHDWKKRR